jgi:phage/plasmid-associated DNA primase
VRRLWNQGQDSEGVPNFYHENFEQTLDEKTHLIGFNNGIFDLNKNQFREGRPEDLTCTDIDYEVRAGDEVLFDEIDDFCKVFPNKDMREYAIGRFANFISGDVSREEFYIFTEWIEWKSQND